MSYDHPYGQASQTGLYPGGNPYEPYPPRNSDEVRLTAILERIERRLIAIEAKLASLALGDSG
jgi:hypothetical protein